MSDDPKVSGGHIKTTSSREEVAPEQALADHCSPEVPCTCETAADLGFSGWGDGVNPNTIVSERPDCPLHGFKPCQYVGCPFPTNPRYDHDHPPDRREVQCGFRRPHKTHLWLWSPSEKVRCWGVAELTAEEYNTGDYDSDFIDLGRQGVMRDGH